MSLQFFNFLCCILVTSFSSWAAGGVSAHPQNSRMTVRVRERIKGDDRLLVPPPVTTAPLQEKAYYSLTLRKMYRVLKCHLSFKHPTIVSCMNSGFGVMQKVKICLCIYPRRSCCTAVEVYRSPGAQPGSLCPVQAYVCCTKRGLLVPQHHPKRPPSPPGPLCLQDRNGLLFPKTEASPYLDRTLIKRANE